MKITNLHGLPQPIVTALEKIQAARDTDGADITVTGLDKPPRMIELERLHGDDVTQDASDMVNILLGHAVHIILREAAPPGAIVEQRFAMDVLGWRVTGQPDLFVPDTGALEDWKVSAVFQMKTGRAEWEAQLNCYAHLLRHHGHDVKSLAAVVFGRDWFASQVGKNGYPEKQVVTIPLELWSPDACQHYLEERVQAHQQARATLPLCTPEERWDRGKGPVRCNSWCTVRQQCEAVKDGQWKAPF